MVCSGIALVFMFVGLWYLWLGSLAAPIRASEDELSCYTHRERARLGVGLALIVTGLWLAFGLSASLLYWRVPVEQGAHGVACIVLLCTIGYSSYHYYWYRQWSAVGVVLPKQVQWL